MLGPGIEVLAIMAVAFIATSLGFAAGASYGEAYGMAVGCGSFGIFLIALCLISIILEKRNG